MNKMIFLIILGSVFYFFWMERRKIFNNLVLFSGQKYKGSSPFFALIMIVLLCLMLRYDGYVFNPRNISMDNALTVLEDIIMVLFGWITIGEKASFFLQKTGLVNGLMIFCAYIVSDTCIGSLLPFKDPQGLSHIEFSKNEAISRAISTIAVGTGEEIFKLTVIIGAFVFLSWLFKTNRLLIVMLSGVVASFIFGMMHSFGWNLQSAIAIGISSIISTMLVIFFRNIWIPILAHIVNDMSQVLYIYNHGHEPQILVVSCILTAVFIVYLKRNTLKISRFEGSRSA